MVACYIIKSVCIHCTHRYPIYKHLRDTVPRQWDNLESPPFPIGNLYRTERMDDPIHRGAHMYRVTFQNKGCRGSFVTCHRHGTRSIGPRAVATPGFKYRIRVRGCMNGYHCTFLKVRTLGCCSIPSPVHFQLLRLTRSVRGVASVCPLLGSLVFELWVAVGSCLSIRLSLQGFLTQDLVAHNQG